MPANVRIAHAITYATHHTSVLVAIGVVVVAALCYRAGRRAN